MSTTASSAATARRAWSWRRCRWPRRAARSPRPRCASGSRATSAAAPATTTSSRPWSPAAPTMVGRGQVIPAKFDYARAESVDEAIALLTEHGDDAKLLAGGHSLLPLMKLRLATPSVLVDVGRLRRAVVHPRRGRPRRHRRAHPPPRRRAQHPAARARAAARARGRSGRRPAGASPRHARRHARTRRPGVRPARRACSRSRGTIVARGSGGERAIAADDFFEGFLESRAGARRGDHRGAGAEGHRRRVRRSRSSTGAPRTGRSSASPRWAAITRASRSSTWAPRPMRAGRGRGPARATAPAPSRPRRWPTTAPSHPPT